MLNFNAIDLKTLNTKTLSANDFKNINAEKLATWLEKELIKGIQVADKVCEISHYDDPQTKDLYFESAYFLSRARYALDQLSKAPDRELDIDFICQQTDMNVIKRIIDKCQEKIKTAFSQTDKAAYNQIFEILCERQLEILKYQAQQQKRRMEDELPPLLDSDSENEEKEEKEINLFDQIEYYQSRIETIEESLKKIEAGQRNLLTDAQLEKITTDLVAILQHEDAEGLCGEALYIQLIGINARAQNCMRNKLPVGIVSQQSFLNSNEVKVTPQSSSNEYNEYNSAIGPLEDLEKERVVPPSPRK